MFDDILSVECVFTHRVSVEMIRPRALTALSYKVELCPGLHPLASRPVRDGDIQGAPFLMDHLRRTMRDWVRGERLVIQQWIDEGHLGGPPPPPQKGGPGAVDLSDLVIKPSITPDFQVQILMVEKGRICKSRTSIMRRSFLTG